MLTAELHDCAASAAVVTAAAAWMNESEMTMQIALWQVSWNANKIYFMIKNSSI